jgi:uncharacterized cupin superfamily protein
MPQHPHIVALAEVPVEEIKAPAGSLFGGRRQRAGAFIGARKLGYSFFTVPPGKAAFPYHTHAANEEMIYVIGGAGVLRFGKDEVEVSAGTVIAFPPGDDYAHQLVNAGAGELRYLVVSTMEFPDLSEYPDSNKVGAYATAAVGQKVGFRALFVKDSNVDYYDGEDGREVERVLKTARGEQ